MSLKSIAFESPSKKDQRLILSLLKDNCSVYVIEPFYAYHHRDAMRFFPPPIPEYIHQLILEKKITLVTAEQLGSRDIYLEASARAVASIESVFPAYKKDVARVIQFVSDEIGAYTQKAFKKNLCDRLAGFFSINILMQRLNQIFGAEFLEVFPHFDATEYEYFKRILDESGEIYFDSENVTIHELAQKRDKRKNYFLRAKLNFLLFMQTIGAIICNAIDNRKNSKETKNYKLGISIIAPKRQFRGNQRGVDFLVDNKKIFPEDVIYIPLVAIDENQKKWLEELGSDIAMLPRLGLYFSNWDVWARLFLLSFKKRVFPRCDLIELVSILFFTYYRWKKLLDRKRIENFITHSDFPNSHIARNIALNQKGTTTWYFTDASNFGHGFRTTNSKWNCHPFWAYQAYDNLVTWNEDLVEYFSRHPESYRNSHVVGSLWSNHVERCKDKSQFLENFFKKDVICDKFIIVAFSSTYTINSFTSYNEGISFSIHMERLAMDFDDVLILLKEKKDKAFHRKVDPVKGNALNLQYEKMNKHPRIAVCSNKLDTSKAMGISDLCISFPYTSTTNEAIGFGIPAIWHDPKGHYRETPYAKYGGLVTHGYEELRQKIFEKKSMEEDFIKDPIKKRTPLFDPYRDGKAIERFRDLLLSQ
jgi:polysaccharide biosynthesis PFTS motif protein